MMKSTEFTGIILGCPIQFTDIIFDDHYYLEIPRSMQKHTDSDHIFDNVEQ